MDCKGPQITVQSSLNRLFIRKRKWLVPFVEKMAITLIIAGTELELRVVLITLTTYLASTVAKEVIPQIIAGSKITKDGSGDQNLQIKLTLRSLTIQDPSRLGYLKISNLVLQEHCKKNRKGKWYLGNTCSRHMTSDK